MSDLGRMRCSRVSSKVEKRRSSSHSCIADMYVSAVRRLGDGSGGGLHGRGFDIVVEVKEIIILEIDIGEEDWGVGVGVFVCYVCTGEVIEGASTSTVAYKAKEAKARIRAGRQRGNRLAAGNLLVLLYIISLTLIIPIRKP